MLTLANDQLTVDVLHPVEDRERMGTRYCTGGYIFQVSDATHGPLLSGPTYPEAFNWFDGQGIPDAFNLGPLRPPSEPFGPTAESVAFAEADPNWGLVIGIGLCDLAANRVLDFCEWDIRKSASALLFRTEHRYLGWNLALTRAISLNGRTIRSATLIENAGPAPVHLRWFPHPFYPQPADGSDALCRVNIAVQAPGSTGYSIDPEHTISRKGWPWQHGVYQALTHNAREPLTLTHFHPQLGPVTCHTSYVPSFFPIWGNACTFSWEPFLERTIAAGQALDWSIEYGF